MSDSILIDPNMCNARKIMKKFKLAVAQFEIAQNQPEKNLEKVKRIIAEISGKADLIVFPEFCVTGILAGQLSLVDKENKYLRIFQGLAQKYQIDIVPGSIIVGKNDKIYNTAYYINSDGKVLSEYQKINLWHPERVHCEAGNEVKVFDTRFGKIGLVICWDLIFTENFRQMLMQDVEMVICPSYWSYGDSAPINAINLNAEVDCVDALCVARAFENNIVMVFCNAAGNIDLGDYKDSLIGHSQITAPILGVIKKLDHNKEEVFVAEIDLSILKDSESVYKIREDLNK